MEPRRASPLPRHAMRRDAMFAAPRYSRRPPLKRTMGASDRMSNVCVTTREYAERNMSHRHNTSVRR